MGGFFGDASVFFQIFLPEFFNRGRAQIFWRGRPDATSSAEIFLLV
jgi:hypothetical protein